MNVQFARSSDVATITLSADEIDRFMASSRGIVNEMRLALLEAMQVADNAVATASKRKEPARISSAGNRHAAASGRASESTWCLDP